MGHFFFFSSLISSAAGASAASFFLPRYSGRFRPAILKRSDIGGTDFIRPLRKLAVEPVPSALLPESQTVTLSNLIPLIAST